MRGTHSAELHNVRSAVISRIDNFNRKLGHAIAWLALALVLVQFTVVVLRYVFSIGFAPMQEAVWHLHGLLFMLGAGYTLLRDEHVRVDVLYREASPKQKAITDFGGCLLFVIDLAQLLRLFPALVSCKKRSVGKVPFCLWRGNKIYDDAAGISAPTPSGHKPH